MQKQLKIIGLTASARKNGNSEIIVKQVLDYCRSEGADVSLCRITELDVKPCRGCYRCLLGLGECPLKDDMFFLIKMLSAADGIVLAYPSYVHNIPGSLKLIQDRVYMSTQASGGSLEGKKALNINVGTNRLGIALPMGELFLKTFLFDIVGSLAFKKCGLPGSSIIKNPQILATLEKYSSLLIKAASEAVSKKKDTSCPFCNRRLVQIVSSSQVACPLCSRRGKIVDGNVIMDEQTYFFEKNFLENYYKDLVTSGNREFFNERTDYFNILDKYKDRNIKIRWIEERENFYE